MKKFLLPILLLASVGILQAQNPSDGCTSIPALTVNASCTQTNYTLPGAYTNGGLVNASCATGQDRDDGWYQFTAVGTTTTIEVTGDEDRAVSVWTACGGGTELGCDMQGAGTTASVTVTTTVGVTYYVQVHRRSGNKTTTLTGKVCVFGPTTLPPANDDCTGATPATVNPDRSCASVTAGTVNISTASAQANACGGTADDDVWFSFVATSTTHYIDLLNIAGSNTDMYHSVYGGTCASIGAPIVCSDPNSSTLTGLTIGNTYYVRVYTWTATGGQNTTFDLCIGTDPAPTTTTACSGSTYDSGGAGGNYSNNETTIEAFCSSVAGQCVSLTFNSFDLESGFDDLEIYDGPNVTSPLIGTYSGTSLNGLTIQSTTGCLTLKFTSDGSVTRAGWDASISCSTCPTCSDGIQNGAELGVDCGGPTCPPCPCGDITIASLPYSNTGINTLGYGDNYDNTMACGSSYLNGDDVLFEYTPAANESVDIILSNTTTTFTGLFLWDGCPDDPSTNCVAFETGGNPSLTCQALTAGTTYFIGVSTWPTPQSVTFDIDITANATGAPSCGLNYTYSTVAYNPVSYTAGSLITFSDDRMADAYTSIGFDFCYDGVLYQDVLVSSNGYILFPGCYSAHPFGTDRAPSDYSPYSINAAAPNTSNAPVNAIMGPWQDIYPSASLVDGEIRTLTTGTTPNQRFSVTFRDVRMFSCTSDDFNGQISLFETTDNAEVHIGEKTVCATFNGGAAILGITDYTGTVAMIPAGYNYPTQWTVSTGSPEGHQWASNCGPCTVLPVELIDFSAKNFGDYNQITWTTATETNNNYFVLERSNGGAMFYEVTTVIGAGNSSNVLSYDHKHDNPSEIEYYRLRQVDYDGKIAYSKIISVRRTGMVEIDVYPNPTQDILKIDFVTEMNENYTVIISDLLGNSIQKQFTTSSENRQLIIEEFRAFAQGFYSVKVIDSNGTTVKTDKIIKN